MKIGFNVKKLQMMFEETIYFFSSKVAQNESKIENHETRITALEESSSSESTGPQ